VREHLAIDLPRNAGHATTVTGQAADGPRPW